MIHKDMTIVDLGGDNWSRLMKLPGELSALRRAGDAAPGRALLIVYRGLKVLKAMDALASTEVQVDWHGTSRLDLVARQTGYPFVVALEESALSRVFGHAQRELDFRADFLEQSGAFLRGAAREWRRTIFTYPAGPARVPLVPYRAVESFTRMLIPDNTVLLFAVTGAWAGVGLGCRQLARWRFLVVELARYCWHGGKRPEGRRPRSRVREALAQVRWESPRRGHGAFGAGAPCALAPPRGRHPVGAQHGGHPHDRRAQALEGAPVRGLPGGNPEIRNAPLGSGTGGAFLLAVMTQRWCISSKRTTAVIVEAPMRRSVRLKPAL